MSEIESSPRAKPAYRQRPTWPRGVQSIVDTDTGKSRSLERLGIAWPALPVLEYLQRIRRHAGTVRSPGLGDQVIEAFAVRDPLLIRAVIEAAHSFEGLRADMPDLIDLDEAEQVRRVQSGYLNFYPEDCVSPYVSLAARGPWVVTLKGAVVHDNGGYGMLGLGHGPHAVLEAMSQNHVMANIMTPNVSQMRLMDALRAEIGHRRESGCPYHHFLCMNSGSESVSVAARIADINARAQTDPGGVHAGKPIRVVALAGAFHGRTDRPAQLSDSTLASYQQHLASFRNRDNLWTIRPNDEAQLRGVYERASREGVFIEACFMEPVMGEGDPGLAITPSFYALARSLSKAHGSMLAIDSIQAGLRAHGCLSIVDYPGFEGLEAPDMETYSKALNAGQFPLSILAMTERASRLYKHGVYGNTMTTNPRAMDVACAVLGEVTPQLRSNIRQRGAELLDKLTSLEQELGDAITKVQGTGLLLSCELSERYKSHGSDSIEEYLRMNGVGVIHGGKSSLRFTPHFGITSAEVDLIVAATRDALRNGPGSSRGASRNP